MSRCSRAWLRLREDDGGFSTLGMVVALLVSLALVFSGVRVYRVRALSAGIQDVADAAALAAERQVSLFVGTARACDAVVLSFTLAGGIAAFVGIAVLCIPGGAAYGEGLLEVAEKTFKLRADFADAAKEGLTAYQECLPFLATVHACAVAAANSADDGGLYAAVAVLAPLEGAEISGGADAGAEDLLSDFRKDADEIRRRAEEAEEVAREGDEIKRQAWLLDCGGDQRTLRERAEHLGGLSGALNPNYSSVDAWSFQVPLSRCKAYYKKRLAAEQPVLGSTIEEQADSMLRQRIYRYAVDEFSKAFAWETEAGFDYYFPVIPRNLPELMDTPMYTERVYPMRWQPDGTIMMHAWKGCPGAAGAGARGSVSMLHQYGCTECPYCRFNGYSLANVCAATSVVNTGFEYYYRQIAELVKQYKGVRDRANEIAAPAKRKISGLFKALQAILEQLGKARISVRPPGSYGALVIVANAAESDITGGLGGSFVGGATSVGARVAVSAATLVEDDSDGAASVITGLPATFGLTGVAGAEGQRTVVDVFLGLWDSVLAVYGNGQEALESTLESTLNRFHWNSSSGLGTWAVGKLRNALGALGLQPAKTAYLKPVLVNTQLVATADDNPAANAFLALKQSADAMASGGNFVLALQQIAVSGGAAGAGAESPPEEGIVVRIAHTLFGEDSPLVFAFELLSGKEAEGSEGASRLIGWLAGGFFALTGSREQRDWR